MQKTRIFAVAGKPIMHSASPAMHNAGFGKLGLHAIYTRLAAPSAKAALEAAMQIGMGGLSITAPYKEEAARLCSRLDAPARKTGAANTIIFRNGRALGFNTDCFGVSRALLENGVRISGRRAVVLGAGGAAKAAAHALIEAGAKVTVANRTYSKAKAVARAAGCKACPLQGRKLEEAMEGAKIVVSTLSTAQRVVPPKLLKRGMAVLDAVYSRPTAISRDAKARGCKVISGREWLLFQGARAFSIFTGKKAPAAAMRRAIAGRAKEGKKKNIALIGFMGSGKTTVAKNMARAGRLRMVEIDHGIARKAGKSIARIFEEDGEAAFRKMERREMAKVRGMEGCVVSCGGGAVLDGRNVEALRKNCIVVWLCAGKEDILRRVGKGKSRPLLNGKGRAASVERLLAKRLPLYAKAADLAVSAGKEKPGSIARLILDEVGIAGKN